MGRAGNVDDIGVDCAGDNVGGLVCSSYRKANQRAGKRNAGDFKVVVLVVRMAVGLWKGTNPEARARKV